MKAASAEAHASIKLDGAGASTTSKYASASLDGESRRR
jgi:hypothetical protein